MKILKLFAFAKLPGAVFSSKISLLSITVSLSFLLDIKFVSIWNELRKSITEKKDKKINGTTTQNQITETTTDSQSYWNGC